MDTSIATIKKEFFAAHPQQAAKDEAMTIASIAMVGAIRHNENLHWNDYGVLCNTLNTLNRIGLAIDRQVDIDVVNIDPSQGGRDFLAEDKKADVVVLCFLFNPEASSVQSEPHIFKPRQNSIYGISSKHHAKNAWVDRLALAEAKIVHAVGSDDTEVGPSRILQGQGQESQYKHIFHDLMTDVIVDRHWATEVSSTIKANTKLGQNIQKLAAGQRYFL